MNNWRELKKEIERIKVRHTKPIGKYKSTDRIVWRKLIDNKVFYYSISGVDTSFKRNARLFKAVDEYDLWRMGKQMGYEPVFFK